MTSWTPAHAVRLSVLCWSCAACSPVEAPLPLLEGEGFFDQPWPSDLRVRADGHPDLTGFPHREDIEIVGGYVDYAESLVGFGNNAPVYLRFAGEIDLDLLPEAADSVAEDSLLLLIDVDEDSPYRGQRVPVEWAWQQEETEFQPENLLAVRPVWGFPLRPVTRYALVVREPLARVGDAMAEAWEPDAPNDEHWQPLQETLFLLGIDVEDVAAATVFTTQDPVGEMAEYASYVQQELDLPAFDEPLVSIATYSNYSLYEGWVYAPLFQQGERPYATQGGGLFRNTAGEPRPYSWEWIRYSLAVPKVPEAPEDGWPLFVYSHGTGGDYITYADAGMGLEPANLLALQGMVGLGIDQPLHGLRATDSTDAEFHSFNFLNPDSARSTLRQGGLDQVFLAAAIAEDPVFDLPAHQGSLRVDTDRMVFLGHSQGGISGSLAGPWLGGQLRGMFLSGAGGGMALSALHRQEGVDITALLETLLDLDDHEQLDTFHPVLALVQWLSDVTDPINYAPYWFHEAPTWDASPISVAMSEGVLDGYTPYQTTEALAAAARVPLLEEVASDSQAHRLRGLEPEPRPVSGNVESHGDGAVTAGLAQYGEHGHFAVFDDSAAAFTYLDFLVSATQDEIPTIEESR